MFFKVFQQILAEKHENHMKITENFGQKTGQKKKLGVKLFLFLVNNWRKSSEFQ